MDAQDIANGRVPSIEDLLQDLLSEKSGHASEGIAGPAHIGEMVKRQFTDAQQAITKEARLFANVFWDDDAGRRVLEELIDQTLRAPQWPVWDINDPQMLLLYGVGREMQNELVRGIMRAINIALEARKQSEAEKDDDDD